MDDLPNLPKALRPMFPSAPNGPVIGVELISWIDGLPNLQYDVLLINPITKGNSLEFRNNKQINTEGYTIPVRNILSTEIQSTTKKGRFGAAKEDLVLEIKFLDATKLEKRIIVNVNDKQIDPVVAEIMKMKEMEKGSESDDYWLQVHAYYNIDGEPKTSTVYPNAAYLAEGEELIWFKESKTDSRDPDTGEVFKNVLWMDVVINFRIFQYNLTRHVGNFLMFEVLDDVVVTEQRRITYSAHSGNYTGVRMGNLSFGSYGGTGSSTGHSVGHVNFLSNGRIWGIFYEIGDPNGLVRLVKAIKKELYSGTKQSSVRNYSALQGGSQFATKQPSEMTKCQSCGSANPLDAVYCNKCSSKLKPVCSKFNSENPSGSTFCNKCGFALV